MQVFALAIPKPIRTVQVFALVIPAAGCSVQILSTGKLPSICPVQLSSMANPVSGGLVQVFAVAETPVFRRFLVVRMILEHRNRRREYWLPTIFRVFHDKMLISEGRGG
ncbi:MAG: hypothetical protein KDA55_15040 [Planctomycetales bacterium]|nr:hypothetical protein [Planctomycetales bacterium]